MNKSVNSFTSVKQFIGILDFLTGFATIDYKFYMTAMQKDALQPLRRSREGEPSAESLLVETFADTTFQALTGNQLVMGVNISLNNCETVAPAHVTRTGGLF